MKCCICGCKINDYGNNPYPLCLKEDRESRCCNDCNNYVIKARLISIQNKKTEIKENDLVVIFCSSNSDAPINALNESGKFLAGQASGNEALPKGCWEGSWGNFILDTNKDSFVVIDK